MSSSLSCVEGRQTTEATCQPVSFQALRQGVLSAQHVAQVMEHGGHLAICSIRETTDLLSHGGRDDKLRTGRAFRARADSQGISGEKGCRQSLEGSAVLEQSIHWREIVGSNFRAGEEGIGAVNEAEDGRLKSRQELRSMTILESACMQEGSQGGPGTMHGNDFNLLDMVAT